MTLITPLVNYVIQHPPERTTGAKKPGGARDVSDIDPSRDALKDFGNWDPYVADIPNVLIIRATPKLKENFWAMIGRQAASTQGVQLPAFKKMRHFSPACGSIAGPPEFIPIHPFRIERRIDASTGTFEGLYVFDPASIGPQCGKVRLVLFSEKALAKGDERVIESRLLNQIQKDLVLFR